MEAKVKSQRSLQHMITAGLILLLLVGCSTGATAPASKWKHTDTPVKEGQHASTFTWSGSHLNYLLFLPQGYREDPQQKWPLILFLHGMGERGNDLEALELVKKHGPPMLVEQQKDFPFIVISPQCPSRSSWSSQLDILDALLDEIVATYAVDPDRQYLTGLSMGGFGTWHFALRYTERFAAIVPIAGGYSFIDKSIPGDICKLKDVPVWAFHGAQDKVILPIKSEVLVNALQKCGGDVRFTLYPDAKHDSWTETYNNPELYRWMLRHTR